MIKAHNNNLPKETNNSSCMMTAAGDINNNLILSPSASLYHHNILGCPSTSQSVSKNISDALSTYSNTIIQKPEYSLPNSGALTAGGNGLKAMEALQNLNLLKQQYLSQQQQKAGLQMKKTDVNNLNNLKLTSTAASSAKSNFPQIVKNEPHDDEGNEIGKLFIGGLSQKTNDASLQSYFSNFGELAAGMVMMDHRTGRSRGFGYVKYSNPSVAKQVAAMEYTHQLDEKIIDVKFCNIHMKGRNKRSLKVFVGGLANSETRESLMAFFTQFGEVTDVNLMMDADKGRHRGFAFVGFTDENVVKLLITHRYVNLGGKTVEIKAMEPPNTTVNNNNSAVMGDMVSKIPDSKSAETKQEKKHQENNLNMNSMDSSVANQVIYNNTLMGYIAASNAAGLVSNEITNNNAAQNIAYSVQQQPSQALYQNITDTQNMNHGNSVLVTGYPTTAVQQTSNATIVNANDVYYTTVPSQCSSSNEGTPSHGGYAVKPSQLMCSVPINENNNANVIHPNNVQQAMYMSNIHSPVIQNFSAGSQVATFQHHPQTALNTQDYNAATMDYSYYISKLNEQYINGNQQNQQSALYQQQATAMMSNMHSPTATYIMPHQTALPNTGIIHQQPSQQTGLYYAATM